MAKKPEKKRNMQPFWRFTLVIYTCIMLYLLFGRSQYWVSGMTYQQMLERNSILTPFHTIDNYLHVIRHHAGSPEAAKCLVELLGNLLMFVPAGWLLPHIFPTMKRFFPFLATSLLCIVFIETMQLFTLLGKFDVDDIILNFFGIMIGYILHQCIIRK